MSSPRFSFKSTAFSLIFCAVIVAVLNLYMNILATYGTSNMQIDLSADGDVIAFHQFEFPAGRNDGSVPHEHHHHDDQQQDVSSLSRNSVKMGLCPPANNLQTQEQYVNSLIRSHVKFLPPKTYAVDPVSAIGRFRSTAKFGGNFEIRKFWPELDAWTTTDERRLWAGNSNFTTLARAATFSKVLKTSTLNSGAQYKLELLLEGGRRVLWLPRRYGRFKFGAGDSQADEMDRHNAEVAAFHLSNLLDLGRTSPAIGRKIHISNELKVTTSDKTLLESLQKNQDGALCLQGSCFSCPKGPAALVCSDDDGYVEGTLLFGLPDAYAKLAKRIRHPWARTYDRSRLAPWQSQTNFCQSILNDEVFGKNPIFGDLIDLSIFDYLIGNTDRRYVEYFHAIDSSSNPNMVTINENGKSFANPNLDETSLLAPLYQCCKIRQRFYRTLLNYSHLNLGDSLNEKLKYDPIYPILADDHLVALNRRLRKVLAVVNFCIEAHGTKEVFIID